jgi:hypothetical protein
MAKQKTLYRDRPAPYVHGPEINREYFDGFVTTDVGAWMYNPEARERYKEIWGQASLDKVDLQGTCAENERITQVGGTFPIQNVNVWGGEDIPEPEPDHTGQICIQSPVGPVWVDASTLPVSAIKATVFFDNIRRIIREEFAKAGK